MDVYFDDFSVTHSHSVIVQVEDYYPFGMSFNQYKAPNKLANSFLFNAGSELNDDTGLYGTFYRNYDPAIGRLTGVDPYAGLYVGHSPYHYALNDPANYNDPTGGNVMPIAFEDDDSGGGGDRISVMDVIMGRNNGAGWAYNLSGHGGMWYGGGSKYAANNGAYGPSYQEANARNYLASLGYVEVDGQWGYYSYGQYTLDDGSLSEPTNNGFTPLFDNGSAAQNGGDPFNGDIFNHLKTAGSVIRGAASIAKIVETEYVAQATINNTIRGVTKAVPNSLSTIAKVAKIGGVTGIAASWGIAGVELYNGTDNTSTWVNAGVNTVILGAGIAATIFAAPAVATAAGVAGVAYGVGYLFYGKEMDQYINDNFGYK